MNISPAKLLWADVPAEVRATKEYLISGHPMVHNGEPVSDQWVEGWAEHILKGGGCKAAVMPYWTHKDGLYLPCQIRPQKGEGFCYTHGGKCKNGKVANKPGPINRTSLCPALDGKRIPAMYCLKICKYYAGRKGYDIVCGWFIIVPRRSDKT